MQSKTHLELATELVTAMISKGQIRVPVDREENWKDHNRKAIHTVGWAILEMYRELQGVRERAKEEPVTSRPEPHLILSQR
jgi:hypothetical protein